MKEENEQGFLSHKFNDFGSEPIPNGWSAIDKELAKQRKRRAPFWMFGSGALLLLLSLAGIWFSTDLNNQPRLSQSSGGVVSEGSSRKSGIKEGKVSSPKVGTQSSNPNGRIASATTAENQSSSKDIDLQIPKNQIAEENREASDVRNVQKTVLADNQSTITRHPKKSGKKHASGVLILANAASGQTLKTSAFRENKERKRTNHSVRSTISKGQEPFIETLSANHNYMHQERNEGSEATSVAFTKETIDYLDLRSAYLVLAPDPKYDAPELVEIQKLESKLGLDSNLIVKKPTRVLSFWSGASVAYAQKTIAVNQAEAVNHVIVGSSFDSKPSWLSQISGSVLYEMPRLRWLQFIGSVSLGFYQQNIGLLSLDREPLGYTLKAKDSLNYSINPSWKVMEENRSQQLLFANFELGIRPLISRWGKSGPFATVQIWTRVFEERTSSMEKGTAFVNPKSSVAVGYRVGYQYLLSEKWQAEIFSGPILQQLVSTTSGISIKPQFFGIGFNRRIW